MSRSPGIGYDPSHELGGNKDWTFSKGCAEALRSKISRKASNEKGNKLINYFS